MVKDRGELSLKWTKGLQHCIKIEIVKLVSTLTFLVMAVWNGYLVQNNNCIWLFISCYIRPLWAYLRFDPDYIIQPAMCAEYKEKEISRKPYKSQCNSNYRTRNWSRDGSGDSSRDS